MVKDYYYILGLQKTCSSMDIKKAYRKLSKRIHPDVNENDKYFEDYFKQIQEAYETISNESIRKSYDPLKGINLGSQKEDDYKTEILNLKASNEYLKRSTNNLNTEKQKLQQENNALKINIAELRKNAESAKDHQKMLNAFNEVLKSKSKTIKRHQVGLIFTIVALLAGLAFISYLKTELTATESKLSLSETNVRHAQQDLVEMEHIKTTAQNMMTQAEDIKIQTENLKREVIEIIQNSERDHQNYSNEPISTGLPFRIDKIDFSDSQTSLSSLFGLNAFLGPIQYIYPTLRITPVSNVGDKLILFIKIFHPNGTLSTGSAKGYSFHQEISYSPNVTSLALLGWGSASGDTYREGRYTMEVWVCNALIARGQFLVVKLF